MIDMRKEKKGMADTITATPLFLVHRTRLELVRSKASSDFKTDIRQRQKTNNYGYKPVFIGFFYGQSYLNKR